MMGGCVNYPRNYFGGTVEEYIFLQVTSVKVNDLIFKLIVSQKQSHNYRIQDNYHQFFFFKRQKIY